MGPGRRSFRHDGECELGRRGSAPRPRRLGSDRRLDDVHLRTRLAEDDPRQRRYQNQLRHLDSAAARTWRTRSCARREVLRAVAAHALSSFPVPELSRTPHRDVRFALYVTIGALIGAAYVGFDVLSESRLETGTLTGPLAGLHEIVDRTSPVLVGALLGVCAHYMRLRRRLSAAEDAASRAEALRTRLQKVERDQAVWVLVAAVLHEVNNPLHALGLLLDEHAVEDGDARRADLLVRARGQADRARSQLAILRSMRGQGEPEVKRIALDRVVGAVADDVGSLAAEDG